MAKTFYQILGIPETASPSELLQAFQHLERQLLDDASNQALIRLERVREAFRVLSAPGKRLDYDRQLAASRRNSSNAQHTAPAWYRSNALLASVTAFAGLFIYWHLESQKIQQAQYEAEQRQQTQLVRAQAAAEHEERERLDQQYQATRQAELERQQMDADYQLSRQSDDSFRALAQQQLDNERNRNERELQLLEQQNAMALRQQEQQLNERNLDMRYRQPTMAMELKRQAEQQALTRQRDALQQHDAAIDAIRDLQAAKLREYQRNQSSNGDISTSNPATDP